MALNDLMQDELKNFRLNFYDLIITYDNNFYNFIKIESDGLIDILTNNIFNDSGPLTLNYEDKIESPVLFSRQKIILKIFEEFK